MKTMQRAVSLLLLAGVIAVGIPATLWAESDAIGGSFLPIDKNAAGTKVAGPLAVYYEVVGINTGGCLPFEVNMSFTMKLTKGTNSYAFASPAPTRLCYEAHGLQVAIIQAFFANTVIPGIFGGSPSFALKSVTDVILSGVKILWLRKSMNAIPATRSAMAAAIT